MTPTMVVENEDDVFERALRDIQAALNMPDFPPDVPAGWADWYAYAASNEWR